MQLELQKAAEEEENKKEIVDLEKKLQDLNKNVEEQVAVSNKLISEDNKRLKNTLENGIT